MQDLTPPPAREGFPSAQVRDHHNQGWTSSLECLEEIV